MNAPEPEAAVKATVDRVVAIILAEAEAVKKRVTWYHPEHNLKELAARIVREILSTEG